ncbi:hypothetical protein VTL71DRAFT_6144 [Oculimacula yallundae]|uniref:Uncharacterized protein n=1 Tax=Oculimacula yallundae TaxID=86028 RepID=A0ABR4C074_9HELO
MGKSNNTAMQFLKDAFICMCILWISFRELSSQSLLVHYPALMPFIYHFLICSFPMTSTQKSPYFTSGVSVFFIVSLR